METCPSCGHLLGQVAARAGAFEEAKANARLISAAPMMHEYIRSSASAGCATAKKILEEIDGRHSYKAKKTMEAFGLMREELKHVRSLNADMLEALQAVTPLMIPGMNWTDDTGQLIKSMIVAAIDKATGGRS